MPFLRTLALNKASIYLLKQISCVARRSCYLPPFGSLRLLLAVQSDAHSQLVLLKLEPVELGNGCGRLVRSLKLYKPVKQSGVDTVALAE